MNSARTAFYVSVLACFVTQIAVGQVTIIPEILNVDPGKSTLVDADLKNVTMEEAFDVVCGRSMIPTRVDVPRKVAKKIISVKFDKTPLGEAMLRICREADIAPMRWNGYSDYSIQDVPKETNNTERGENWIFGPVSNDGPFCGVLDKTVYTRTLSFDKPGQITRRLMLFVDTIPEPQVLIYEIDPWLIVTHAQDENGTILKDTVNYNQMIQCSGTNNSTSAIPDAPANIGHQLAQITVQRKVKIVRKFRRVEMDGDDLFGTEFTTDGITAEMPKPIDKKDFGFEFKLNLHLGKDAPASALISAGTLCVAIDDAGRVMRTLGRSSAEKDGVVTVVYNFCPMLPQDGDARPDKLLVFLPLEGAVVTPTYTFANVRLDPLDPDATRQK